MQSNDFMGNIIIFEPETHYDSEAYKSTLLQFNTVSTNNNNKDNKDNKDQ